MKLYEHEVKYTVDQHHTYRCRYSSITWWAERCHTHNVFLFTNPRAKELVESAKAQRPNQEYFCVSHPVAEEIE